MVGDSPVVEMTSPSRPPWPRRWMFLYALLVLIGVLLGGRSFYLQVVRGAGFREAAEGNRVAPISITAPRGIIYDQHGTQLVENIASTDLFFDPVTLPAEEYESTLIETLPEIAGVPRDTVVTALHQARERQRPVRVAAALDHETVLAIEQRRHELPGLQLSASLVRKYPYGQTLAHVLGYTSPVTADELTENPDLLPIDITGKTGVERRYDSALHGQHGVSYVEVDAGGTQQKQLERFEPVPGADLYLSIDAELQAYLLTLFEELRQDEENALGYPNPDPVRGAVVVLDPESGAVQALASFPQYDPNIFSQPALRTQADEVIADELQPLFNRAVTGTYPPGSTIKPMLAAAALQEDIITPQTTVLSVGGLSIGPWHFPDWRAGGHGTTDVFKAIADSVNTFFYLAVGGDESRAGLGLERTTHYLEDFGWGSATGIDMPGEASGFLPTAEWKETVKNEAWYIGDTYHLAIGQGDVLATPLQLAVATAAIANGGTVVMPYVADYSMGVDGAQVALPHTSRQSSIDSQHLATVRQAMRETVVAGSGRYLSDFPMPLAGKTGTAQIGGTEETHAWFTSFGPYEDPAAVVVVLLERGGAGDQQAVPLAKKIWAWLSEQRDL